MLGPMPRFIAAAFLIGVVVCISFGPAKAQAGLQNQAFNRWHIQDQCTAKSVVKYPDHNAKSLQARDTMVNQCLKDHGLPPREPLAPKASDPASPATP